MNLRSLPWLQGTDFPQFYCAARILAQGHGGQLYDPSLQRQYQARYTGRVGPLYNHPPYEALLYLTVAWLPFKYAYLLWFFLNTGFLATAAHHLSTTVLHRPGPHKLLAASLTFVPGMLCLLQGQDSLLLLLLVILTYSALRQDRALASGWWLGLGLFKFQIVLPLAVVLVLTRGRSRFAKGFGVTALALAGCSAALCGWQVFFDYPRFLLHYSEQPFAGIVPEAMANFRGLTDLLKLGHTAPVWSVATVSVLSAAALLKTLTAWRGRQLDPSLGPTAYPSADRFDLAFANTVLFALLVSYHLNPHDLSLLLLPLILLYVRLTQNPRWRSRRVDWMTLAFLWLLFLPPLHLWALRMGTYAIVSIPLLALFLFTGGPSAISSSCEAPVR